MGLFVIEGDLVVGFVVGLWVLFSVYLLYIEGDLDSCCGFSRRGEREERGKNQDRL